MKKMIALLLALVLVLAMTACGSKGPKRDSKGYLTEDSAESIAAQSVGYMAEDVAFGETKFEGDSAGGDGSDVHHIPVAKADGNDGTYHKAAGHTCQQRDGTGQTAFFHFL